MAVGMPDNNDDVNDNNNKNDNVVMVSDERD